MNEITTLQDISQEDIFEAHLAVQEDLEEKVECCSNTPSPRNNLEEFPIPLNPCDLLPASAPHASALLDLLPSLLPPDSWLTTHLASTITKVVMSGVVEQMLEVSNTAQFVNNYDVISTCMGIRYLD